MEKGVFRFMGYYLTSWYNERKEIEVEHELSTKGRFVKDGQLIRNISCNALAVDNNKKIKVFADAGTKVKLVKVLK